MILIQVLSILGLLVSLYAFRTELKIKHDKKFKAICDKNNKVSCSKAFLSKYNNLSGIPNSLAGVIFYLILFLLITYNLKEFIFPLTLLAFIGSLFLGYLSYVKLKVFCIVCNLIYLINLGLVILSYKI